MNVVSELCVDCANNGEYYTKERNAASFIISSPYCLVTRMTFLDRRLNCFNLWDTNYIQ